MTARIVKGFDSYKGIELYRVVGINNEFVGEWFKTKEECIKEAQQENLQIVEK